VLDPATNGRYGQMLKVASPSSTVGFTSLSSSTHATISTQLETVVSKSSSSKKPAQHFVSQESILTYLASASPPIPISKVCLLDPKAPKALSPEDGQPGKFEFFLFGGILGDDPPRDRTGELRAMGFEGRHLREVQMTTDTALHVTKLVVEDQSEFRGGELSQRIVSDVPGILNTS
jgi:ribosome biogenesis SPOUT family RNA methylase Rps3